MKNFPLLPLLVAIAALPIGGTSSQVMETPPKPTVYVGDFELDVLPAKGGKAAQPSVPASAPDTPAQKNEGDDPAAQANRLINLVSTNLIAAFQKAGYTTERLGRDQGRPSGGVQIRGIFAEVDKQNHWRRGLIRTGSDTGKLQVLVSVANLARPEQALYEIAHLPGNENKPGAVITLSPYVPLEKYEIDKDSSEDLIKKLAARVVNDVTALLNANPAAVSQ